MKQIRVNTTVVNEACEERREFIYDGKPLTANVVMNDAGYVWAYFYEEGETWTIALGNLTVSNIDQADMLKLLTAIDEQSKKYNKKEEVDVA